MLAKKFYVSRQFHINERNIYPIWRLDCVNQDSEEAKTTSKEFKSKLPAYFAGMYYSLFGN